MVGGGVSSFNCTDQIGSVILAQLPIGGVAPRSIPVRRWGGTKIDSSRGAPGFRESDRLHFSSPLLPPPPEHLIVTLVEPHSRATEIGSAISVLRVPRQFDQPRRPGQQGRRPSPTA